MLAMRKANEPDYRIPVVRPRRLSADEVKVITRRNALDRRFRGTDRFLQRWAVGQGSDLPLAPEDADKLPPSRPPPLGHSDAILADIAILDSPEWAKSFVFGWYRSDRSPEQIAAELDLDRREIYREWRLVLAYFLGRFTEIGFKIPQWESDT